MKPIQLKVLGNIRSSSRTVADIAIASRISPQRALNILYKLEKADLIVKTSYGGQMRFRSNLRTLSEKGVKEIPHNIPDYPNEMDYGTHIRQYSWEEVEDEAELIKYEEGQYSFKDFLKIVDK